MSCWYNVGRVRRHWILAHRHHAIVRKCRNLTTNHRGPGSISGQSGQRESVVSEERISQRETVSKVDNSFRNSARTNFVPSATPLSLHDSLESFLHYASQTNLSRSSTVFRGTKYEYTCLNTLVKLGFNLKRVGGAHDAGIDLEGKWLLPNLPVPLQTFVQCKLLTKKSVSPVLIRELEGTSASRRSTDSDDMTISILCTPTLATKAVREAVRESKRPVVLASIDEEGWLQAITWNAATQEICENIKTGLRYVGGRKEAVILVDDQLWEPQIDLADFNK